jgi:integrase
MIRKLSSLPRRVYQKHGAYYFVTIERKWIRLCSVADGMAAMYEALAATLKADNTHDSMPAVIGRWVKSKLPEWADKTATDQERISKVMAEAFADLAPAQVTTPVCVAYLKTFAETPRTYNLHRTMLRQVLAFAALEGLREGFNPVDNVPTKTLAGRKRLVTDAEIAALKVAAMQQARNGAALVQMIDLALLTGQRIGDLIKMRWQDVTDEGVLVEQGKTGQRLLIQWSPALRAAIEACNRGDKIGHVLKTQSGRGYQYAGIRSAWVRACERAGIKDLNIHDLRGRAGMDARDAGSLESAKELLGHKSIRMTEAYVDGKAPRKAKPSR